MPKAMPAIILINGGQDNQTTKEESTTNPTHSKSEKPETTDNNIDKEN